MDPILTELLWTRLQSVTNEQAAALVRASFTPVVSEAEDIAAAVFDEQGQMLAQAVRGTPGHILSTAHSVQHLLREFPPPSLTPGDVLITNDPWKTSGHLHDITVVTPVFSGNRLVAFLGNTCHAIDVGGRPMGALARDVYEEGLFIPPLKLLAAGVFDETLTRIIQANVRKPIAVLGDLRAQVIGNEVGARRLVEVMNEFELESLDRLSSEILTRSEQAMRNAITQIPSGRYESHGVADGFDRPVRLQVAVLIEGDEVTIDCTGTDPQSDHGINVVYNYTYAYAIFAVKCITLPELPNNAGALRPIKLVAPLGSILNAQRPAPVAARHTLGQMIPSLIFRALAQVVPGRVVAEGYDADWVVQPYGRDAQGDFFLSHLVWTGGTGARPMRDGMSATGFPARSQSVPIEVVESSSPLIFHRRQLRPDSGGPGMFRGGLGQTVEFEIADNYRTIISPKIDRLTNPARGIAGGRPGARGAFSVSSGMTPGPKEDFESAAGTLLRFETPGGGGYGQPMKRDVNLVAQDVRNGLVSRESASWDYGVVIDERSLLVDERATAELRQGFRVPSNSERRYLSGEIA
jgi:N-methylhydantoinase B